VLAELALPLSAEWRSLGAARHRRKANRRDRPGRSKQRVADHYPRTKNPISALNEADRKRLFHIVRAACEGGYHDVYVSHRLEEVARQSPTTYVLRDGSLFRAKRTRRPETFRFHRLSRAMIGRAVGESVSQQAAGNHAAPGAQSVLASSENCGKPPALGRFRFTAFEAGRNRIIPLPHISLPSSFWLAGAGGGPA